MTADCSPGARGWSAFAARDYLGDPAVPLRRAVRDVVAEQTGARPEGPIRLLTQLRSFGHCFNPVSFYYCFEPSGEQVQALVAEVTNTPWGERHAYVIDGRAARLAVLAGQFDKALHVSPFMGMDHRYDARARVPARDAVGPHRLEPRGRHRVRRDAGAAPPRADARARSRGITCRVPARDRPRAGADLCTRARAEARAACPSTPTRESGTDMSVGSHAGSCSLALWAGSRSAA